jgi:predicted hydrolase (HD superfamily)
MLAVETCVRWYANQRGADVEQWGRAGLLHDFDYEAHPSEHPNWGLDLLRGLGEDEAVLQAIAAHAPERTGVSPTAELDRYLFACDELAGLITAVVYVRPSKSILVVEVKSVLKKFKEPSFAAGVNRDDVRQGAELIGLPLEEHVANMLTAMKANAEALGLQGVAV